MNKLPFGISLVAIALTGCALTPERANELSSLQLCKVAMAAPAQATVKLALDTVASRGESCDKYAAAIQQQDAQSAAMLQALTGAYAASMMSARQPVMAPTSLPMQTKCTTSGAQMNCATW